MLELPFFFHPGTPNWYGLVSLGAPEPEAILLSLDARVALLLPSRHPKLVRIGLVRCTRTRTLWCVSLGVSAEQPALTHGRSLASLRLRIVVVPASHEKHGLPTSDHAQAGGDQRHSKRRSSPARREPLSALHVHEYRLRENRSGCGLCRDPRF